MERLVTLRLRPVLQAGPSKHVNWYNPNMGGSTTPAGLRGTDGDAMCGIAVMYDAIAGKIFTAGGAPSYEVRCRRLVCALSLYCT